MACYTSGDITNFVSADQNRIMGEIAMYTARRSPYTDLLETGTIENNAGETFRAVVQNRTKVAASLTIPTFTDVGDICRQTGGVDKTGTTEYPYQEGVLRGQSEEICVNQAKQAFKTSYLRVTASIKQGFVKIKDADIRGQLFLKSGVKATVIEGVNPESTFNGDIGDISTPFLAQLPNSYVTFKYIKRLANYMLDNLFAEPFEQNGVMAKCILSREAGDRFRDEIDFKADLRALTTGKYRIGEEGIDSFEFDGPYRGIAFATDPRPLRAAVGGGGPNVPGMEGLGMQLVEPEILVATTNGNAAKTNPVWKTAFYEILCLSFQGSFRYMAATNWMGEGEVDFPFALAPTTLKFENLKDAGCNVWGDMGVFLYQINRGYRPEYPSNVAFVIYRRCLQDLDLAQCNSSGNLI